MYLANHWFLHFFLNNIISTWLGGNKRYCPGTTHLGIAGLNSINNLYININIKIKMMMMMFAIKTMLMMMMTRKVWTWVALVTKLNVSLDNSLQSSDRDV